MLNPEVDGIFGDCVDKNCLQHCLMAVICTDFFAVRVSALPKDAFTKYQDMKHAEGQATSVFRHITKMGRDRFLQGTKLKGTCRIRGNDNLPVLHAHTLLRHCPLCRGEPRKRNIF